MRKLALAAAATVALWSTTANAGVIVADSGWQSDTLTGAGSPTAQSPWTFTTASSALLSVSDGFVTGDTYTLSGDLTGTTTFFAGLASDVQASGSFGSEWLSSSYSKIAVAVGPGTYTFSITGPGQGGIPAGLGVRLDSVRGAVPEPATWAMMLLGFGAIGASMRRRRTIQTTFQMA